MCKIRLTSFLLLLLISVVGFNSIAQNRLQNKQRSSAQAAQNRGNANNSGNPVENAARRGSDFVEKTDKGEINYTDQYIEATGVSIIDTTRFRNRSQALAMARRGAVVDAQRNLLETVKGVNVRSETTVEDLITTSDRIETRVEGVVKGAKIIGKPRMVDGMVEVTLRMPMYESKASLASAIEEGVPAPNTPNVDSSSAGARQGMAVASVASPTTEGANPNVTNTNKNVAFRINGKFDPSMFPVITNEKGELLLDMKKIYDVNNGKFPKIIQQSRELMNAAGFRKGVEVIDLIQDAATGQLKVMDSKRSGINWTRVGEVATKIGRFLLMLL